jgi:hypothetical protein
LWCWIPPVVWFRAPSEAITVLAVVAELREQLLAWERELSVRESALLARERGVVEGGRAHMECNTIYDQVASFWGDYPPRLRTFTAGRRCSMEFDLVLSGRQFILSVQEVDLERREERLTADQVWCLHPSVRRNFSLELGELWERVAGVRDGRAVEGEQLSRLTMAVSDALVDLNVLPIQGIPVTPHVSSM